MISIITSTNCNVQIAIKCIQGGLEDILIKDSTKLLRTVNIRTGSRDWHSMYLIMDIT